MDLDIINVNGQIVERREGVNVHNDGNRISIRELNSGMYILRLTTTDEEVQLPFVKMRP
jgi:Fe2+ transport system protein B